MAGRAGARELGRAGARELGRAAGAERVVVRRVVVDRLDVVRLLDRVVVDDRLVVVRLLLDGRPAVVDRPLRLGGVRLRAGLSRSTVDASMGVASIRDSSVSAAKAGADRPIMAMRVSAGFMASPAC